MPETRSFTLTYPEAPKSLNDGGAGSRRHWSVGYLEKSKWHEIYSGLLEIEGVPRGASHIHVDAAIHWRIRRRRDETNYEPAIVKPLADVFVHGTTRTKKAKVLVRGGWIPDDTSEFFEFGELSFAYPKPWPHPLTDSFLELRITATYPNLTMPKREGTRTSVEFTADLSGSGPRPSVHSVTNILQITKNRMDAISTRWLRTARRNTGNSGPDLYLSSSAIEVAGGGVAR